MNSGKGKSEYKLAIRGLPSISPLVMPIEVVITSRNIKVVNETKRVFIR
ncbi:MAG: hypothetical protein QW232_07270 [Saccharolobus sp.]